MTPPREDRHERARVVASIAEYLATDLHRLPDRALEAMEALDEWCEGDHDLLAEALSDVVQDRRLGQRVPAETTREAAELLQLVAQAS